MAEGIAEAAQAFQTEIAPGASRPRDDAGRFTSSGKPETMFEERRVEGDPLTGDTRDGGPDPRLAEIERRIADGRSEEGDEDRLEGYAARSGKTAAQAQGEGGERRLLRGPEERGDAAADDGHEGAEAQQAEQGEEQPEQDAESKFQVTLNGQPVEKFEVTVDGRPQEVTLDEALKGYIAERTFHQRMSQVQTARQQVDEAAAQTAQWRDYYGQKLMLLDRELAELTPAEPDWDAEFRANPAQAREKQKAFSAIYQKRQQLAQEQERTAHEARGEYDRQAQAYAVREFGRFVQEANIPDENALQSRMGRMRAYGKLRGFAEGELATVYDSRMLHVLDDASKYHELMANRPKAIAPGKGKTLVPGRATPIGNAPRRQIDDAQNRLAKSGRLEDAAAVMSRLIR